MKFFNAQSLQYSSVVDFGEKYFPNMIYKIYRYKIVGGNITKQVLPMMRLVSLFDS